jgi:hypothetical protein
MASASDGEAGQLAETVSGSPPETEEGEDNRPDNPRTSELPTTSSDDGAGEQQQIDSDTSGVTDGIVIPLILVESRIRQWAGLSNITEYEGSLWFTTQAGFFRANTEFNTVTFVSGNGPVSGDEFKLVAGKVFFSRKSLYGTGRGLYSMDTDGGNVTRLFDGAAAGFDIDGNTLYYLDIRDGSLYKKDMTDASSEAVRVVDGATDTNVVDTSATGGATGAITADVIICYPSVSAGLEGAVIGTGGFITRRPDHNYDLYYHRPDGQTQRLTEGGSGIPVYFNNRLLYSAWNANETMRYLDLTGLPVQ